MSGIQAFVLAAGLGTRLKPWTEHHPKALVPVDGVPVVSHVIGRLREAGADLVAINMHHFSEQLDDYLRSRDWGLDLVCIDEHPHLLETGGGLLNALGFLRPEDPVLVHNVDILSDAPLSRLVERHTSSGNDVTLLTSERESSRKLIFNSEGRLAGWHNLQTGEYRPTGYSRQNGDVEVSFSGIYVVNPGVRESLARFSSLRGDGSFPVMDWLLSDPRGVKTGRCHIRNLRLLDIGKPDSLAKASAFLSRLNGS